MSFDYKKLDRFRTIIPVSTFVLLVGCILVTLASVFPSNVTAMKYILGMIGWSLLDGEIETSHRLLDYSDIRNITNVLIFSVPFAAVIWTSRTHLSDWLTVFLIISWLMCSLWAYTHELSYPLFVLMTVSTFLIPALTIIWLSSGSRTTCWLSVLVWSGGLLWIFAQGWVRPVGVPIGFFVPLSIISFLLLSGTIVLLSRTRIGRWVPSFMVSAWLGLFLSVYLVGPIIH